MSGLQRLAERWSGPGTTVVLGLLCLVLAVGAATGVWWDRQPGSTRPTPTTPVTSVVARDVALESAGELAQEVLSYSWQGFDERVAATRGLLTSGYVATYDAQMTDLRRQVVSGRVTVRATATDTAVVSASPDQAVALVFLDQVSGTRGSAGERRDQVRVLVTLQPDGREWRLARLDSF